MVDNYQTNKINVADVLYSATALKETFSLEQEKAEVYRDFWILIEWYIVVLFRFYDFLNHCEPHRKLSWKLQAGSANKWILHSNISKCTLAWSSHQSMAELIFRIFLETLFWLFIFGILHL